ncbi:hypothetical protein LSAT2_005665, partial [Lamellibrachia satsuma]
YRDSCNDDKMHLVNGHAGLGLHCRVVSCHQSHVGWWRHLVTNCVIIHPENIGFGAIRDCDRSGLYQDILSRTIHGATAR